MRIDRYEAKEDTYYTYKENALYRNVSAGQVLDRTRSTRKAGNYKVYVDSFVGAALPYSVYNVADTRTGKVYRIEVQLPANGALNRVVETLKNM